MRQKTPIAKTLTIIEVKIIVKVTTIIIEITVTSIKITSNVVIETTRE